MTWSDDKLSAYMDGELPADEAAALERDLAIDAGLAARLERLGAANEAFIKSISAVDAAPMPGPTWALLAGTGMQEGARIIPFRPRSIGAFLVEHRAIAAALVCAVAVYGVTVMSLSDPTPAIPASSAVIAANSPLHRALEQTPSGGAVQLAGGVAIKPQLTFETADNIFCRQYQVNSDGGMMEAIACREGEGWRLRVASFDLRSQGAGDYQTAGSAHSLALEAFIGANIAGTPFGAADEAALLTDGWRR